MALEQVRRDRSRYFDQVLECRELIRTAPRGSGSAPAERRGSVAFAAPRSVTPRGRLPPLPRRGRRWDHFWEESRALRCFKVLYASLGSFL